MPHLDRLFKETFGGDGEELGGVGGSVPVEQRSATELRVTDETLVLHSGHFEPGLIFLLVIKRRNAIDIVAPSSGGLIGRQALSGPRVRSRLAETLRQDDPTQIGAIGEIVIVIPRP